MTARASPSKAKRRPATTAKRPDTPSQLPSQGLPKTGAPVANRTMVILRCLFISLQAIAIPVVYYGMKSEIPLLLSYQLIGANAIYTAAISMIPAVNRSARPWWATSQLSVDVVQLSFLLYVTGGLANPFCLLLIIPVTLAGTTLPPRHALALTVLAMVCALLVVVTPLWRPGGMAPGLAVTPARIARSYALVVAIAFAGGFAAWAAAGAQRMVQALQVTETVLAREQKLTALDGLAAAAAHELGTPLATITVVAKELARESPPGPLRDDAWLLVEQAERCRDILKRLARAPEITDAMYERITLTQFISEILAPYLGQPAVRTEGLIAGPRGSPPPDIWRMSEVSHAISAFVENAFDFARSEILVVGRFDAKTITIEVRDDGPGIDAEVLAKLGEPYITSRPGAEGSRTSHVGMGLGFFIAKTLLERTGAVVEAKNIRREGAVVMAQWPRAALEAIEPAPAAPAATEAVVKRSAVKAAA